ncbi:cupin domain-containing protein [Gammaproteobacteria bacterium]|nr:cupin domain-containing protein [Gammaproteobacteria bacterium]
MRDNMNIGERLRHLRHQHGLSQRALARRAGVTNAMISMIETGKTSPTIASLKKLLDVFPLSMEAFFADETQVAPRFYRAEELLEVGTGSLSYRLVGADRQPRNLCVMHERYPPGGDSGAEMLSHPGEEGGVVVRGMIELTVGDQKRSLACGDAYYFDTAIPHRFRNLGDELAEVVSASTPPTY